MATNIGLALLLFVLAIIGSGHTSSSSDPPSYPQSDTGYEVPIVELNPLDKSFILNEEKLAKLVAHKKCRDLPVSVISVAGDNRKEKLLLLNFILLYLRHADQAPGKSLAPNWLDQLPDALVTGFDWKRAEDLHTTALSMWSEPFVLPVKDKNKNSYQDTCILLMDTNGSVDHQNEWKDTAKIFGLSSMISSNTIYSVFQNLQENDLHNLDSFVQKFAHIQSGDNEQHNGNKTPFQNLLFVIQDWSNADQKYPYGFEGGNKYIDSKLNAEHPEGKNMRSYYDSVSAFLMPSSGQKVDDQLDPSKSSLNPPFVKNVQEFVHRLVSPNHLVKTRTLMGNELTGISLFAYFRAYFGLFKSSTPPSPKDIMDATAEAKIQAAASVAKEHYRREMMSDISKFGGAANPVQLEVAHRKSLEEAVKTFDEILKVEQVNNPELSDANRQNAMDTINELWKVIKSKNQAAWEEKVRAEHMEAIWTATEHYIGKIGKKITEEKFRYVEPAVLSKLHKEAVKSATEVYNSAKKLGGPADHQVYRISLMKQLGEEYGLFQETMEKHLYLIKEFSKGNPAKRLWQKRQLRRKFKKQLKERLKEAEDHRITLFKKIADEHAYYWNLIGSIMSIVGFVLTVALFAG